MIGRHPDVVRIAAVCLLVPPCCGAVHEAAPALKGLQLSAGGTQEAGAIAQAGVGEPPSRGGEAWLRCLAVVWPAHVGALVLPSWLL